MDSSGLHSFHLDPDLEDQVHQCLIEHFTHVYQERVNGYVETLMETDHYVRRLKYFLLSISERADRPGATILISGCGAGSEMIAAREVGFKKIHGVEVDWFWVKLCQERLFKYPSIYPILYGGNVLPYPDCVFDVIASGHVIEHTSNPGLYLHECMRTLNPGGYLFLEFPNRYYYRELHTNLPSFEWLPRLVRNRILLMLSSDYSPLRMEYKIKYQSILGTGLQQISMLGIKQMLRKSMHPYKILHQKTVVPGVVRCVVWKK